MREDVKLFQGNYMITWEQIIIARSYVAGGSETSELGRDGLFHSHSLQLGRMIPNKYYNETIICSHL